MKQLTELSTKIKKVTTYVKIITMSSIPILAAILFLSTDILSETLTKYLLITLMGIIIMTIIVAVIIQSKLFSIQQKIYKILSKKQNEYIKMAIRYILKDNHKYAAHIINHFIENDTHIKPFLSGVVIGMELNIDKTNGVNILNNFYNLYED